MPERKDPFKTSLQSAMGELKAWTTGAETSIRGLARAYENEMLKGTDGIVSYSKTEFKGMWDAFARGAGDSSRIGEKSFETLKKSFRTLASTFPQYFKDAGIDIDEVFAVTAAGARRNSEEHEHITEARYGKIKSILKNHLKDVADVDDMASKIFLAGSDGHVAAIDNELKDISTLRRKGQISSSQADEKELALKKRLKAAGTDKGKAELAVEEKVHDAAAKRLKTTATDIALGGSLTSSLFRKSKTLHEAAVIEEQNSRAVRRGSREALTGYTAEQVGVMGIAKVFGGLETAITSAAAAVMPFTSVAGFFLRLLDGFDRTKKSAAGLVQVMATGGPVAGGMFSEVASSMGPMAADAARIRTEIGALAGVNIEDLQIQSAAVAATLGGMAGKERQVIDGFTRIQIIAPLAGIDAQAALQMIARGQGVFGFSSSKQIEGYFERIRAGARSAQMGFQDFISKTGIEKIALTWGLSSEQMLQDSQRVSAVIGSMKGGPAGRAMLSEAFSGFATPSIGFQAMLRMAAGAKSFNEAMGQVIGEPSPMMGSIDSVRKIMKSKGFAGRELSPAELGKMGLFAAGAFKVSDEAAFKMVRDPELRKAMLEETDPKALQDAIRRARLEDNPMKQAAELSQTQLTTLEQIRNIMDEFFQTVMRSSFLDMTKAGKDFSRHIDAVVEHDRLGSNPAVKPGQFASTFGNP